MTFILKNKKLEVHIDHPTDQYRFSRFDWTGKITLASFNGKQISGTELFQEPHNRTAGQGFYNEFGIDAAIGFKEAAEGEWFHKIGVGLLQKSGNSYLFHEPYEIRPAHFEAHMKEGQLHLSCQSEAYKGYAYFLKKVIALKESGFAIQYELTNQGNQKIVTNEYNHNFLSFDNQLVGQDYVLKFPFDVRKEHMGEVVNPEGLIEIQQNKLGFIDTPEKQFFFSNLSGGKVVPAQWALENNRLQIGISETGDFQTNAINVWGWRHVISPELFISIELEPGKIMQWTRSYQVYELA